MTVTARADRTVRRHPHRSQDRLEFPLTAATVSSSIAAFEGPRADPLFGQPQRPRPCPVALRTPSALLLHRGRSR